VALVVGLVAIVLAAVNMVGGFVVTDRMLQMFTRKKPAAPKSRPGQGRLMPTWIQLVFLACGVCFILALKGLSGRRPPATATCLGAAAAVVACLMPFFWEDLTSSTVPLIIGRDRGGHVGGVYGARTVQMTQMPQMVALFNGVGGGAASLVALLELQQVIDAGGHDAWFNLAATRSRSRSAQCRSPARSSPSPSSRT
jgi:hypothetical protein